jgi:hypothetical protein
MVMNFREK